VNKIIIAALAAGLSLTVAASSFAAEADKKQPEDGIAATVNGQPVYQSEIGLLYQSLPEQYKRMPIQMLHDQLVSAVIDRKLIAQAANKDGLGEDEQVKKSIRFYEEGVLQDRYLAVNIESQLTEEKLRKIYQNMAAEKTPEDEVHARHILVEKEETAKAIIKQLVGGADFAELAKTKSTGPSGPRGGDLGFFKRQAMVPAFATAAFAMKVGGFTKTAVKTEFGWHIIKVEARRPGKNPTFEEMVDEIRQNEGQKLSLALIEGLRKAGEIKRFDKDGKEIKPAAPAKEAAPAAKKKN
jgi:peptidyl-prolyl cis-trans isomerase C